MLLIETKLKVLCTEVVDGFRAIILTMALVRYLSWVAASRTKRTGTSTEGDAFSGATSVDDSSQRVRR